MAIASPAQLLAALPSAQHVAVEKGATGTTSAGGMHTFWTETGSVVASNPPTGTGEIPTRSTTGALYFDNPLGGARSYLAGLVVTAPTLNGQVIVVDRLWHASGYSAAITTSQAVNSLALTRADGVDCELWIELLTVIGSGATNLTISYTDAYGVARSTVLAIPGSSTQVRRAFKANTPGGISSVQSIQFSANTGAAGNVGLVICKRITTARFIGGTPTQFDAYGCGFAEIADDACIGIFCRTVSASAYSVYVDMLIAQG